MIWGSASRFMFSLMIDVRTKYSVDKDQDYNPYISMAGPALTMPTDTRAVRRRKKAEILACIVDDDRENISFLRG
jgi:hypothetical protein